MRRLAALAAAATMCGCAAVPDLVGVGAGGAAGAATANPAVAIAVGIGVRAAVREGMSYANRTRQETRQLAMADAVGAEREPRHWQAEHWLGFGNTAGRLQVLRNIETPLATCKEVAFTVDGEDMPYIAVVCPKGDGWAWGMAEPAVDRWGSLQ